MVTVAMAEEDRFRMQVDQILDIDRTAPQVCNIRRRRQLEALNVGVEQDDSALYRDGQRRVCDPGEENLVLLDGAAVGVDIFNAEEFLPCTDQRGICCGQPR